MDSKKIRVRALCDSDQEVISGWAEKRGRAVPPLSVRGNVGMVTEQGGRPIAAVFTLATASGVVFLEFFDTDPELSQIRQGRAFLTLLSETILALKKSGFRSIIGFVDNGNISAQRAFERVGGVVMPRSYNATYMEL